MKKILSFILTVFTAALLFAAARPSLDGRAVVAEEGEMPKGLFARTIGYLPGDSVTVTNPANGSTVDVLILGSIDSSEGVAILLSPEAAERLSIKKDSNVQVKITKRTGSLDENASGTAVISEDDDVTDYTKSSKLEEDFSNNEASEEAAPLIPPAETSSENTAVEEKLFAEPVVPVENAPASEEIILPSESVSADAADEANQEVISETVPAVEEEIPVEKIDGTAPEMPVEESEAVTEDAPAIEENTPEEMVDESAPEVEENNETPVETEEIPLPEVENANEEYAPIILVPSEPNPPEAEETPVEVEAPASSVVAEDIPAEVSEPAPAIETTVETTVEAPVVNDGFEMFIKNENELEKGKYYLQIAALGSKENLDNLAGKYGSKYPLAFVPLSKGNGYKVMVGPLTADEYGMITERFKSYGFKDSFLKKIR